MMEPFTSGKVSADARLAYLENHPEVKPDQFEPVRGGYKMFAWQSQIDMARACGRGRRSGRNLPPHPFDERRPA